MSKNEHLEEILKGFEAGAELFNVYGSSSFWRMVDEETDRLIKERINEHQRHKHR